MAQLTGGQAMVQSLKKHGVDTMFVLPGVQLDNIFDALYDERDSIRLYHTRHEQATSYMADGYARTTGKPGVCLVVPGPGLLNAMAGLSTAYATNSPVLCISGQIQSDLIGVGRGLLHEIPHQLEMMRSVTKWASRVESPEAAPALVREAFERMLSGRPRPVHLEMSPDIMGKVGEVSLLDAAEVDAPAGDPDKLEAAAKALGQSKKPVIFVGGGVMDATEELLALAEMLEAPVVMSSNGRGAVSSRHHLAQNMLVGRELWKDADVILAVGTRLSQPLTQWGTDPDWTLIHMDADAEEIGRTHEPTIGIVANSRAGLAELVERAGKHNSRRESREEELNALKGRFDDILHEIQPQAAFAGAVRDAMPDDGIVVAEMTQVSYWSSNGFPVYEPRTYITSGYQGTLGYGYGTALGAQVGNPDKRVISINGDGGFMYNVQELSTAVMHKIPLTAVVFNDGAFGNVKRIQQENYRGRTIASDLLNPDFVKLAESFGMLGLRTETPDGLKDAIGEALKHDGPALIEVPVGPMPNPSRLIGWGSAPKQHRKD